MNRRAYIDRGIHAAHQIYQYTEKISVWQLFPEI